jgi:hypothetical protein
MEGFINKQKGVYRSLIDANNRYALIPKLASNVHLVKENETTLVQRIEINDVLFSLPESDLGFLEDLKNNMSCRDLKEKHEMNEEDFWGILIPLWERKAIIFHDEV